MVRLIEKYQKEVIPQMMEKFGYKNTMAVPKIEKVVVNTGLRYQPCQLVRSLSYHCEILYKKFLNRGK